MKSFELFEWKENKGSSVDIKLDFFSDSQTISLNIDYRNISGQQSDKSIFDPDSLLAKNWYLHNAEKNHPEIAKDLSSMNDEIQTVNENIEAEATELVEAFKSMINAMLLEGKTHLDAKWETIWNKYKDLEEIQNEMNKRRGL